MNLHLKTKVTIDKLAIVGADAGTFESTVNSPVFDFIERHSLGRFPYKRNFYCTDGSFINYGTELETVSPIRYEFNPNLIEPSKENTHRQNVVRILRTMKYPKINRFDLAVDIRGVDLSKFDITDKHGRKTNNFRDGVGRLETLYIGATSSELRIRIYDKAREQKDDSQGHWWRIEAQIRGSACDPLNGTVGNDRGKFTPQTYNPFDGLEIQSRYTGELLEFENVKERIFIQHLQTNPETLQELSKPTRLKYKKILATLGSDQDKQKIDLAKIYENSKAKIDSEMLQWVRYSQRNNVI